MGDIENRSGRDTRLLVLVIVIALAVLLLLARIRFPSTEVPSAALTTGPLERLVAQASYDDLAAAISSVVQRAAPAVVLLQVDADAAAAVQTPKAAPVPTPLARRSRRVLGVRIGTDLAIVHVPNGFHVAVIGGDSASLEVRRLDAPRQVAIVRVPAGNGVAITPAIVTGFSGFAYVAAVEAGLGGPTAKPVFVGRVDPIDDEPWGQGVLALGGTSDIPSGALVFTLDGRFIGLAIERTEGGLGLVPFALLEAATMVPGGDGVGRRP